MAITVSSLELLGNFKPYGIIASSGPSTTMPLLTAAFNCGGSRSIARRSFCKLRSVLVKSGIASGAKTEEKAEADDRHLIDDNPARAYSSIHTKERDFTGTPYVPVYVYLPEGAINMNCELVDPDYLINQLRILKSINVDGVVVDCWWGIVEAHTPEQYNWSGYKQLFQIVRDLNLKLQVVMSFHEFGGNACDDSHIPLPQWVEEIGSKHPDIFFTDREGRRNHECLTWGIDQERVLRGRIALQVYYDYMRSFRVEFSEFLEDGVISEIKIGLGPCGELRYPSHPARHGWKYPGIGEFQCYDKYLMKSLEKEAQATGKPFWGRGPDNAGSYNSRPHETRFFCDKGAYESGYGKFFLKWYSQTLIDHLQRVLTAAKMALIHTPLAVKLPCIHWWHHTASQAAELTAGFCHNASYQYIGARLREKYVTTLNFQCVESQTLDHHQDSPETLGNPQALLVKAQSAAYDNWVPFGCENVLPCYDREGYNKILEHAKLLKDGPLEPYIHPAAFSYFRLSLDIVEGSNLKEFERFVKKMHGESVLDLEPCHEEEQ